MPISAGADGCNMSIREGFDMKRITPVLGIALLLALSLRAQADEVMTVLQMDTVTAGAAAPASAVSSAPEAAETASSAAATAAASAAAGAASAAASASAASGTAVATAAATATAAAAPAPEAAPEAPPTEIAPLPRLSAKELSDKIIGEIQQSQQ